MTKFIFVLIFLSLFGLNAYIYWSTEKKIQTFAKSPPFRMEDFTKSNRLNSLSKIKHLTDKDQSTYWRKERTSQNPEYDLELELTLTHFYQDKTFFPKEFHSLKFYPCSHDQPTNQNPPEMKVDLFLREAINVDKELRLPTDTKIGSFQFKFSEQNPHSIDIKSLIQLKETNTYPDGIFILTLFLKETKDNPENPKVCITEIQVE